jgi:hypothetical protein
MKIKKICVCKTQGGSWARQGDRGTTPLILNPALRGGEWPTPAVKNPGTNQQEAEWDPDPVRTFQRREKSVDPVRIRTPDRTACNPDYTLLWQRNLRYLKLTWRKKEDREKRRQIFYVSYAEAMGNTVLLDVGP